MEMFTKKELFQHWDEDKFLEFLETGKTVLFYERETAEIFKEYAILNEYNICIHNVSAGFLIRLEKQFIRSQNV